MEFYHLLENIKKQSLNRGLGTLKTASKELVHKKREFLGNKITDAVAKSNENKVVKREPVDEIIIPPEKREEILNERYCKNETL